MEEIKFNRKMYDAIKKYDRRQMQVYIETIYITARKYGYKEGFEDGVKAGDNADFKIKLVQLLDKTKGVGDKTRNKVLATLKEMED